MNRLKEHDETSLSSLYRRLVPRRETRINMTAREKVYYEIKSWTLVILAVFFIRAGIIEAYQIPTGSMETTIHVGDFLLGNKFIFGARTPDWVGIPFTRFGFDIPYYQLPALREPENGDIIIFKYPRDPWTNYVKRCIGIPGDSVTVINKIPYVNGKKFSDPPHSVIDYNRIIPANLLEANIYPRNNGNRDNYRMLYIPREGDTLVLAEQKPDMLEDIVAMDGHRLTFRNGSYHIDGEKQDFYVVEQDYYFMMGDNRDNSSDSRYWGLVPRKYILGTPLIMYFSLDSDQPWYKLHKKIRWERILRTVS